MPAAKPSATPAPPAASPDDQGPTPHTHAMAAALGAILDRVKDSRQALPLMAALENSLRNKGLRAITGTSLDTMGKVASQLDALPVAVDDAPMHALKLHVLERLEPPTLLPANSLRSNFGAGDALEVGEASMSDFMHASHQMSGLMAAEQALEPTPSLPAHAGAKTG